VILCRRCHMLFDIKDLTRKFLRHRDRKQALEMSAKVLIDAGIKLSELKSGNVQRGVYHYMHKLYGENYYERLCLKRTKTGRYKRNRLATRLGIQPPYPPVRDIMPL